MKLEIGQNRDSFLNSGPWLPTESMNICIVSNIFLTS